MVVVVTWERGEGRGLFGGYWVTRYSDHLPLLKSGLNDKLDRNNFFN